MNWKTLAQDLQTAYANYIALSAQINPELREKSGVCGVWSPKDVAAHLIGWDVEVNYALQLYADGRGATYDPSGIDADEFNAKSIATRQVLSWDDMLKNLEESHGKIQQTVTVLIERGYSAESGFGYALIGRKNDYNFHADQLAEWVE